MKRQYARLTVVEYDRPVAAEDTEFLFCLKQGLIMCLREKEFLNEKQCSAAVFQGIYRKQTGLDTS